MHARATFYVEARIPEDDLVEVEIDESFGAVYPDRLARV
jgi:hypothetical protein